MKELKYKEALKEINKGNLDFLLLTSKCNFTNLELKETIRLIIKYLICCLSNKVITKEEVKLIIGIENIRYKLDKEELQNGVY